MGDPVNGASTDSRRKATVPRDDHQGLVEKVRAEREHDYEAGDAGIALHVSGVRGLTVSTPENGRRVMLHGAGEGGRPIAVELIREEHPTTLIIEIGR